MIIREKAEAIKFLITRKFPPIVAASLPPSLLLGKRPELKVSALVRTRLEREIAEYRDKLEALPANELEALLVSESAKAEEERVAESQREEEIRFFNQPYAAADFDHWSKAAHWTLEEAVALCLGKAPEVVNWRTLQSYQAVSPFVFRYARLWDLAKRATLWQKLFDPVLPIIFVNWAKDSAIEFPAALAEKVIKINGNMIDWKAEYEKLDHQSDDHIAGWKNIAEERGKLLEASIQRIALLQSKLEESETKLRINPALPNPQKPQSAREREGMLKVIYAMAVGGYGFNKQQQKSTVVPDIVRDLELQGLLLSDDTVRRYIKAACELLPEWLEHR